MQAVTLTITVPIPPRECSPNGRYHYMAKARAIRSYRKTVAALAIKAAQEAPWTNSRPMWERATVGLTFYVKTRRGLLSDTDNRLSSAKAAFDALRDAGIVRDDRGLTHEPVSLEHDSANPRLVMRVRETVAATKPHDHRDGWSAAEQMAADMRGEIQG